MPHPVLEARAVSKSFPGGVVALRDVDLIVSSGETVALIGESGCGKTTLLRLFNRLAEPTSGEVRVRGNDLRTTDPIALRRGLGYVQQEGGLLPHWTIERNVGLVPRLLGWEPSRVTSRAEELLSLVGLEPGRYRNRYPLELSGGQRQRVAFARALAADPDVVLLDEPFGALDALTRRELQDEFQDIKRRLEKTMLFVTHDLDEAFLLADRIAVMREGVILQLDRSDAIRRHPADDYVAALVGHGLRDGGGRA